MFNFHGDPTKFTMNMVKSGRVRHRIHHPEQLGGVPSVKAKRLTRRRRGYVYFGGYEFPIRDIQSHFFVCGGTGSTKSKQTFIAANDFIAGIRSGDVQAVFCFDPKRDFSRIPTKGVRRVIYDLSNPNSYDWDFAKDHQDYYAAVEAAKIIVTRRENSNADPFWELLGQAVIAGIIITLINRFGDRWTLADVYNAATLPLDKLIKFLRRCRINRPLINILLEASNEKTKDGVRMQILSSIQSFAGAAAHSQYAKKRVSLQGFNGIWIFQQDNSSRAVSTPIMHAAFRRLVDFTNSKLATDRKTVFFIEEARFIGRLPGSSLLDLAVYSRQAGGILWINVQAVENMVTLYGQHETNEILGNCAFKAALKTDSPYTARYFSDQFGETSGFYETGSLNYSHNRGDGGVSYSSGQQYTTIRNVPYSKLLSLPQPSKKRGVQAYYQCPFWNEVGRHVHIPGNTLEAMLPRMSKPCLPERKPLSQQMPCPWTKAQEKWFLTGGRRNKSKKRIPSPIGVASMPEWEQAIARGIFDYVGAVVLKHVADAKRHYDS